MNELNNRKMSSGEILFKKGEPKNSKLVLLIEGALATSNGQSYANKRCMFVNEEAFFSEKG